MSELEIELAELDSKIEHAKEVKRKYIEAYIERHCSVKIGDRVPVNSINPDDSLCFTVHEIRMNYDIHGVMCYFCFGEKYPQYHHKLQVSES